MITDQTGVLDLEATGGVGGRNVEQHRAPTPLLPQEQQILQEAEVTTPPRRGAHGPGGRQALEPQSPPGGTRAVPQMFTDIRTRNVGSDRRDDAWSPGNVLVDMVARMQPRFGGTTSWEQYRQVFDAIVLSNGWDDATAALQLLSHLEGDALNVALLVPMARWTSRTGLVDALSAHYG